MSQKAYYDHTHDVNENHKFKKSTLKAREHAYDRDVVSRRSHPRLVAELYTAAVLPRAYDRFTLGDEL